MRLLRDFLDWIRFEWEEWRVSRSSYRAWQRGLDRIGQEYQREQEREELEAAEHRRKDFFEHRAEKQ